MLGKCVYAWSAEPGCLSGLLATGALLRLPAPYAAVSVLTLLLCYLLPAASCRLLCCSDPHLQFVEEVALPPPEVAIDLAEQERNERELAEAVNAPLPADDDDELID